MANCRECEEEQETCPRCGDLAEAQREIARLRECIAEIKADAEAKYDRDPPTVPLLYKAIQAADTLAIIAKHEVTP